MSLSLYQQYIAKSRYARYLDDQHRREHWPETVVRYVDFIFQHLREKHDFQSSNQERQQIIDAIEQMRVMPSMRSMMTAGVALARDHTAGYNCLAGDTLVTTKEYGIVPIAELAGLEVHIVDGNGQWTLAPCKSFGYQEVYDVEFGTSGGGKFVVQATADHRWLTRDGQWTTTGKLKAGNRLASVLMPERVSVDPESTDFRRGVQHGIIYADGTAIKRESVARGFIIRLCGDSQPLSEYFSEYPVSYPPSYGGEPVFYVYDRAVDLKSLPTAELFSTDYLVGFIRGWLAGDGTVTASGQVSLSCDAVGYQWLMAVGPRLGFCPRNVNSTISDTNFKRNQQQFSVELDRRWLSEADFLLQYKRDKFVWVDPTVHPGFGLVKSVKYAGKKQVYCFTVPTTGSFLLTKNLLTGNCAFLPVDDLKSFDEAMFILMCGTGVGFSVERQSVNKLPEIPEKLYQSDTKIVVKDSKEGWAKALRVLISMLYSGEIPGWDTSRLRKKGARLKTFGGRSSGPEPLEELFRFVVRIFVNAAGRKLTSIECHDIMCKIAEVVVVGGVRRSAMISLSNLSDDRMRHAKSGAWWEQNGQRALSNNSAVYTERPDVGIFMEEWLALYNSKSGERGIFSREAATAVAARNGRRDPNHEFGTNPCSEIILRPYQFCNLTEVVIRVDDDENQIAEKVRLAAMLGTFQSTLTHFPYLRKIWQRNTEEERLLGVSLTGIYDNKLTWDLTDPDLGARLERFRQIAIDTNKYWAERLGIPVSAAITCVKPSGTVSQLVDSASGIHPRHDPYYFRRVRGDNKDPLTKLLTDSGVPAEPDVMKPTATTVFTFPQKSPEQSAVRKDISAIDHLNLWLVYQRFWCEHKPSVTISVREQDWPSVGAWIWDHFDEVSGISFLPYDGGTYRQAPYETVTEQQYQQLLEKMPTSIDWQSFKEFEDNVEGTQTLACVAGGCEL